MIFGSMRDNLDWKVSLSLNIDYNHLLPHIEDINRKYLMNVNAMMNVIVQSIFRLRTLNLQASPWRKVLYSAKVYAAHIVHCYTYSFTTIHSHSTVFPEKSRHRFLGGKISEVWSLVNFYLGIKSEKDMSTYISRI